MQQHFRIKIEFLYLFMQLLNLYCYKVCFGLTTLLSYCQNNISLFEEGLYFTEQIYPLLDGLLI